MQNITPAAVPEQTDQAVAGTTLQNVGLRGTPGRANPPYPRVSGGHLGSRLVAHQDPNLHPVLQQPVNYVINNPL
jgi:hypothetical protein